MDLGCLDLGCISVSEKHSTETVPDSDNRESDASEKVTTASKVGKNKSPRGTAQSTLNVLNKFTSQIKKPSYRKNSPLNWFPRKKVDSYLKRKIKMLQEVDGMNLTLDETLGDSNPHYSRVLREKIAAREAAHKAMEARKAALMEASWCRILKAARIQSKEAEAHLLKAEKTAAEAFDVATAMGVVMYDKPNCPRMPCEIETSTVNEGRATTHTVTVSFETAFEVDKEVAAAVKTAFIRLANCPSYNKHEFKNLLWKISQNPDMGDDNLEALEFSSECESESGSEIETISQNSAFTSQDIDVNVVKFNVAKQRKYMRRQSLEKLNVTKIVDMMFERLKCLTEDELSSLATIVATCGLNAALAEVDSSKLDDTGSGSDYISSQPLNIPHRVSSMSAGTMRHLNVEHFMNGHMRRNQVESELPSLDKFLVKHVSKLEREVQEAKNSKRNELREGNKESIEKIEYGKVNLDGNTVSSGTFPDLESILLKHSSKFEKEIEEAKKNSGRNFGIGHKKTVSDLTSSEAIPGLESILIKNSLNLEKEVEKIGRHFGKINDMNGEGLGKSPNRVINQRKDDVPEVPSLDKFLVKHVSKLEKEVQEAKNKRKNDPAVKRRVTGRKKVDSSTIVSESEKNASSFSTGEIVEKENIDLNKGENRKSNMEKEESAMNLKLPNAAECTCESFTQIEQENVNVGKALSVQGLKAGNNEIEEESLDKILIKPVHRLEREKLQALSTYGNLMHQKKDGANAVIDCEGLDKVLVKHVSRLEKQKLGLNSKEEYLKVKRDDKNKHSQMNEEGSLDQILVKHKSRLEREKMASVEQPVDQIKLSKSRREARQRELQEAWGGLTLGNSIRPHLSKLEREKAAWIKAEEEERRRHMGEEV